MVQGTTDSSLKGIIDKHKKNFVFTSGTAERRDGVGEGGCREYKILY